MSFKSETITKIQVFKNSGRPVDDSLDSKYMVDWQAFYDKAGERAKLDMMKLQRYLSFGSHCLQLKYAETYFITSFAELADLHVNSGYPISFGLDASSHTPIFIIQDHGAN